MRKVFLVFLLAFILILPAIARADLNYGLVAYYSFNNCDATDDSGNGHDGTIYGNPECVEGITGKAFYFDGNDDWIGLQNNGDLSFNASKDEFTVSLWIKAKNLNKEYTIMMDRYNSNNQQSYNFTIRPKTWEAWDWHGIHKLDNTHFYNFANNSWCGANENGNVLTAYIYKIIDNWHNLTVVNNSSGKKLYIDGELVDYMDKINCNTKNMDKYITLGAGYYGKVTNFFNGVIDEVRIYNRALSKNEINELYKKDFKENISSNKCNISNDNFDRNEIYQEAYNKGYEDGKNSCSGNSQENPFLPPTTSSQCATFDFVSNIFSVPCFEAGKTTYSLDFKLINTKPVQLELTNVKKK